MSQPPPPIEVKRSENYRNIHVNGVYGGHRPGFFEAVIYSDELLADGALSEQPPNPRKIKILRTLEARLQFDPIQAKSILRWLGDHVTKYEKQFGTIPEPGKEGFRDFR